MSRPRKTPQSREAEARDAFRMEVRLQRTRFGITQKELADRTGTDPSVMSRLMADPDRMSVERLRKIIRTLDINPEVVLAYLGYEPIKNRN